MDLIPLFLFIFHLPSLFAGTTIRFNFKGKKLQPNSKPFYVPPPQSSESSLPTILLASSVASSMMKDALILHKELHDKNRADRRDGVIANIKTGIENAAGSIGSIGSRLDVKSGLNNLFDKFQPLWGRQPTFGSMLSDISNTKPNEMKSFKLPDSIAEKLGTSSITTSSNSYSHGSDQTSSGSAPVAKWANPFVNYPAAKSQPSKVNTPSPSPQTTPAPSSIRHQVVMPFAAPGQTLSGNNFPPATYSQYPYPYANGYPGYQQYRPGMSASHPYAVVVPPPSATTTPAPQAPKTPRTIVIEEDDEDEEGGESGKGGEISIGGIQATQMLKGAAQVLKGVAESTGVNFGNVMQTMITTAVSSVAAGLAAARPQTPGSNVPQLFQPPTPYQPYPQMSQQHFPQQPLQITPQQNFLSQQQVQQAQPPTQQQYNQNQVTHQTFQPQQQVVQPATPPMQQQYNQNQVSQQTQQQPQQQQFNQNQVSQHIQQNLQQQQHNQQPSHQQQPSQDQSQAQSNNFQQTKPQQQEQKSQRQVSSAESDPLNNNPKSKDEVFDDGDEEVIVIRRPKLKPKQSTSSTSIMNFTPDSQINSNSYPTQILPSNPFIDEVPQMSVPIQSAIDLHTLASQLSSLVSASGSSSSNDHNQGTSSSSSKDKSSTRPYIKIGINFKLQNPNGPMTSVTDDKVSN